jgi:hypothetical protein
MLLRDPSELSASEIALWDALAVKAKAPDPQSGGSAWQIAALACSRRAGSQIVLRQTSDSQIAFALTEPRRVCRRPFSLREWTYDRQEAETSLLARGA